MKTEDLRGPIKKYSIYKYIKVPSPILIRVTLLYTGSNIQLSYTVFCMKINFQINKCSFVPDHITFISINVNHMPKKLKTFDELIQIGTTHFIFLYYLPVF